MMSFSFPSRLRSGIRAHGRLPLLLTLCAAASCSYLEDGGGGPGPFEPRSTRFACTQDPFVIVEGRWLAYLGSEAATGPNGRDANRDGDVQDLVAVLVDMAAEQQISLGVAAEEIAILGDDIYLVTSEDEDGRDWSGDILLDDQVLLHWRRGQGLSYVANLSQRGRRPILIEGDRLYFVDAPAIPLFAPDTTFSYVDVAAPTTVVRVQNVDGISTLDPIIRGSDEGLVFLLLDEAVEGADLNSDLDLTDQHVLALFDANDPIGTIRNVGLAVSGESVPIRARETAPNDYLVGFLVEEASQGGTNLNDPILFDPAWQPAHCAGLEDTDTNDNVLFFLHFAAWFPNPGANPAVNTGLVGSDRILAVPGTGGFQGWVGTLSFEEDEGTCSLNIDDLDDPNNQDQEDFVFRWCEATTPVLPFNNINQLFAMRQAEGEAKGASDLNDRFIVVLNDNTDGRDLDGDPDTGFNNLLGILNPNDGAAARWSLDHGTTGFQPAGVNWMKEDRENGRLLLSFAEVVFGAPLNSSDSDILDSIAVFARFDPIDFDDLDFPGAPIATDSFDAGLVLAGGIAFFRVSEQNNFRDYNGDRDRNDIVLFRTQIDTQRKTRYIATLKNNNFTNDPPGKVVAGGSFGVAYQANEVRDRHDWNHDGDKNDFVIRWFSLP